MLDNTMPFVINDGGRAAAGYRGETGDCVTRSIAIATGLPYQQVYEDLMARLHLHAETSRDRVAHRIRERGASPRNGIATVVYKPYLIRTLGWRWNPTMHIGTGTIVHLRATELPSGRLIVRVSRHLTAVIDGTVHDTHDPSRDGHRCVYGYFTPPTKDEHHHDLRDAMRHELRAGRLIDAIILARRRTGMALSEAIRIADTIRADINKHP